MKICRHTKYFPLVPPLDIKLAEFERGKKERLLLHTNQEYRWWVGCYFSFAFPPLTLQTLWLAVHFRCTSTCTEKRCEKKTKWEAQHTFSKFSAEQGRRKGGWLGLAVRERTLSSHRLFQKKALRTRERARALPERAPCESASPSPAVPFSLCRRVGAEEEEREG